MNKEIVYADSRDGQATWKYEVIDRTISGKLVCKAVNHEDLGLILLNPDTIYHIPSELCPQCGCHRENYRETMGEDCHCYVNSAGNI